MKSMAMKTGWMQTGTMALLGLLLLGGAGCSRVKAVNATKAWVEKEIGTGVRTETTTALELEEVSVFGPFRLGQFTVGAAMGDGGRSIATELWIRGRDARQGWIQRRYGFDAQLKPDGDGMRLEQATLTEIDPLGPGYQLWSTIWRCALFMFLAMLPTGFLRAELRPMMAVWGLVIGGFVVYAMYDVWYAVLTSFVVVVLMGSMAKALVRRGQAS